MGAGKGASRGPGVGGGGGGAGEGETSGDADAVALAVGCEELPQALRTTRPSTRAAPAIRLKDVIKTLT
jgi:hypothetical protein